MPPKSKKPAAAANSTSSSAEEEVGVIRSFKIAESSIGATGGRYLVKPGKVPYVAAKKAATRLFKKAEDGGKGKRAKRAPKSITFKLQESTRGSSKTVHCYVAVQTNKVKSFEVPNPKYDPEDKASSKTVTITRNVIKVTVCDKKE